MACSRNFTSDSMRAANAMTKFGAPNEAGEVVPYDYGNVYFRQRRRRASAATLRLISDCRWEMAEGCRESQQKPCRVSLST
jgi:hypothetical protein